MINSYWQIFLLQLETMSNGVRLAGLVGRKPSLSGQGINGTWLRLGWNQKKRGTSLTEEGCLLWLVYLILEAFPGGYIYSSKPFLV